MEQLGILSEHYEAFFKFLNKGKVNDHLHPAGTLQSFASWRLHVMIYHTVSVVSPIWY